MSKTNNEVAKEQLSPYDIKRQMYPQPATSPLGSVTTIYTDRAREHIWAGISQIQTFSHVLYIKVGSLVIV